MSSCSRLLLQRHGRHGCPHKVREGSDVVGSEDHGCQEVVDSHCHQRSPTCESFFTWAKSITSDCHRRRRSRLTVTSAHTPSCMHTTSCKLLARHRHWRVGSPVHCSGKQVPHFTQSNRVRETPRTRRVFHAPLGAMSQLSPHGYELNILTTNRTCSHNQGQRNSHISST